MSQAPSSVATIESTTTISSHETKPNLKRVVFLVAVLGLAQFVVFVTAYVPSAFFPKEAELKGITGLETGLIMGVLHLVVLFAVYIELKLMRIWSPKKQLLCGLVFSGAACVAFGFANMIEHKITYFVSHLMIRVIHGAALGATDVSSFLLTNMVTPIQYLSTAMGVLEAMFSVAVLVANPFGAFLSQVGGYQAPFIAVGGVSILFAVVVYLCIEDLEYKESTGVMFALKNTVTPRILYYLYSFVMYGALLGFFGSMLEPKLREFNLTLSQVGLVMMISNGVQAITFPIHGQICDRTGKYEWVTLMSYVIIIVGMLMFGPFPGLVSVFQYFPVLIVSIVICAVGISGLSVSVFLQCKIKFLNMGFNHDVAGSLVSVSFLGFGNLGTNSGDILGGLFVDYLGYRYGAVLWASLMLLGIVLQFVARYFNTKKSCEKPDCRITHFKITNVQPVADRIKMPESLQ